MKYNIDVLKLGASDDNYVVTELMFKLGDLIEAGSIIASYESSKADMELCTEYAGYIEYVVNVGDRVSPGQTLAIIHENEILKESLQIETISLASPEKTISEKAKELIKFYNLDISVFNKNIIKEKDVKEYLILSNSIDMNSYDVPIYLEREEIYISNNLIKVVSREISNSVIWGENIKIDCDKLVIEDNVIIGSNVFLKGKEIFIGKESRIGSNVILTNSLYEGSLFVGHRCMIGSNSYLNNEKNIVLENDVCVSSDVKFITHRQWHSPLLGGESYFSEIVIKNNSFIGPGSIIMPGVVVNEWTTVLANSSIVNNLESKILAGGVPAIKIKDNNRLNLLVDLDQRFKIIIKALNNFNYMLPNRNWILCKQSNNFSYKITNLSNNVQFILNIISTIDQLNSKSEIYILLQGILPEDFEGIEIENHNIRVTDYLSHRYLYNSFFNSGIHLKSI